MIMRHWMDCPITTQGRLRRWTMFTRRPQEGPRADTGAVCYDMNAYGRAVVIPGVTTEAAAYPGEVESMCVASGQGSLILEGEEYPIRPGSSFTLPPGAPHHFCNPGESELELIFGRRPPASTDGDFVLHHWTEDRPQDQQGTSFQGHWHHIYRGPSAEVHSADLPPHKFSHPHNHPEILDEIWYVHRGDGWHWMGQEYRAHGPGWALWLDPTELHSLMNPGADNVEYIYCASWPLVADRNRTDQGAQDPPSTPAETAAALEEKFAALVQAYRRTDIAIHGVNENIPALESLIQTLRDQV